MSRRKKPGSGSNPQGGETLRLPVSFDAETFHHVRDLAVKQGVSAAEQIRQLVEIGLEEINQPQKGKIDGTATAQGR